MTRIGFGYSVGDPIAVGGGFVFGWFNEQQYLDRLRGPLGGVLTYTRLGSIDSARHDAKGPIDLYEVRCEEIAEPQHLYFDIYAPGPNGVPEGFSLNDAHCPWTLPVSIVRLSDEEPSTSTQLKPKKWRIVDSKGQVFGFVDWKGDGFPAIDLPEHTGRLMHEQLSPFVTISPPAHLSTVLDDFFERFLPTSSKGVIRGEPVAEEADDQWQGPVWGEESIRKSRATRALIWIALALLGTAAAVALFVLV